ncbi:MAG: sulfatase family protein [Thermomicrobiales bacterium]
MAHAERPNIVCVITHDTGIHLGCYGAGVATPHLDALAMEGVRFNQAHCTAPQCSPSRASLLTGLYPHANGMLGLAHRGWELRPDIRCLPHYLADGGYATYHFGFQHEAYRHPERLGYQHSDTSTINAASVAAKVSACIANQPVAPFFIMAGFDETHRPFDRPGYDPDPPESVTVPPWLPDILAVREEIGQLNGMVKAVDRAVAAIRAAIADHPQAANTLFIYTTDHGTAMPRAKGMLYEPGTRTALLMHWPLGFVGGQRVSDLLVNVDILPTLLDAAGLPIPTGLHGRSFLPLLRDEPYRPHAHIFTELTWHDRYNPMRGVRTARYTYARSFIAAPLVYMPSDILNSPSGAALAPAYYGAVRPPEEFYDRATDPLEQVNLAHDPAHASEFARLRGLVEAWMNATNDPLLRGPVRGKPEDEPGWGYPFPPSIARTVGRGEDRHV